MHRVDSLAQLQAELPQRLRRGPRVLKQHRGHSGIGVWRVEREAGASEVLRVRHAQRGSEEERMEFAAFLERMAPYFEVGNGGHIIDQAWQPRLVDGMVRAYLVEDRVAGFGIQAVNALFPGSDGEPPPQAGPRLYYGPDLPQFQDLRASLESRWIKLLRAQTGLPRKRLPLLWDCDFLLGERNGSGDRYVLCEVNVSSVSPFPPSAIPTMVAAVRSRLRIKLA